MGRSVVVSNYHSFEACELVNFNVLLRKFRNSRASDDLCTEVRFSKSKNPHYYKFDFLPGRSLFALGQLCVSAPCSLCWFFSSYVSSPSFGTSHGLVVSRWVGGSVVVSS